MNPTETPQPETEQRTDFGKPPTEREVLRVLWASRGEHLVRSEIHRRMPQAHRPTLGRIGQILAAFYDAQLLERQDQRSQGSRKAGFYALSERGRELCRNLGFEREERQLFDVTEQALRTWLTQERLARKPKQPGRIVAVYGWSGRLGRTTLVAHVAKGLAESLSVDQPVVAIDLDLAAPGLNDFFAPQGAGLYRGLGGLLVDFERRPPRKRSLWLRGALSSREYMLQPLEDVPNLLYLPSGLSPGADMLMASERAEALTALRAATGLPAPPDRRELGRSFLSELAAALSERFARIVIDPDYGHNVGAWVATQQLADELILCAHVTDTSPTTLKGLRAVLASFLDERAARGSGGGVTFLFRLTDQTTRKDLNRWIDQHLVLEDTDPENPRSYRAEQLAYDLRLAERCCRWENTHFYKHVIARLDPRGGRTTEPERPELQALSVVLNPKKHIDNRSIAAGVLENAPLPELARWVDWYVKEGAIPKATDRKGEELVKNIVSFQAERLLSKILGPQVKPPDLT